MVRGLIFLAITLAGIAEACQDQLSTGYCQDLKKQGFCEKLPDFKLMCKKTCGVCTGPATKAPATNPKPSGPATKAPATNPKPSDSNSQCGISSVPQGRVIAGHDAKVGAWPWQIAMYIGGVFACGGSLVTPEWVITAAHCVQRFRDPRYYTIKLGAHNFQMTESSVQTRSVSRIISHPNYGNLNHDLALMKLDRPAVINDRVRTVCLPKESEVIPIGSKCFITGWGKIRHPGWSHHILQQADLPIVDSTECNKWNRRVINIPISDFMVCAGHGPQNPKGGCHGDSGGPLVCQQGNGNAFTLHGAVSWGSPRCHTGDAYTVFARITRFRRWIAQYIPL